MSYNLQIPNIIALVEQWKRRILAPIGRMTVIKSLLILKPIHLFILLANPKKKTISYLNIYFFNFCGNLRLVKLRGRSLYGTIQ